MRYLMLGLAAVLAVSACGDTDLEPGAPTVSATPVTVATTVPPTTTSPPVTDPSTAAPPPATEPATTSSQPAPEPTEPLRSLDDLELDFIEVASGFTQPVFVASPPGDQRMFVVDQPGVIWVMAESDPAVFLDIAADVVFQNEQGLLGLAFHPDFVTNQLFYVSYIAHNGDTVVEAVTAAGERADAGSRTEIFRTDQPAGNHNGGMTAFGPDGNLWIGLGDGGGSNDQFGHGQRVDSPLASMIRITVGPGIEGYRIPGGNVAGEVWAVGLRNPWRWDFDGDDLWIADVGQNRIEEISVVDWKAGNPNYGWPIMEGSECFEADSCDQTGLVVPVYEYPHSEGCSITGGVVYRGGAIPELAGQYLFADYCTGWLRSVDRSGEMREWLPAGTFSGVTSFGVDSNGEVYLMTTAGSIFALTRAA